MLIWVNYSLLNEASSALLRRKQHTLYYIKKKAKTIKLINSKSIYPNLLFFNTMLDAVNAKK